MRLFQGEVQPDGAVRLDVAVLPGNAGSVQQQRIEHLRVVADVPHGFVLEKKPRKRHIANTVPVILTDEKQAKRFAEKVLSASEKVKRWFEKLLKDLRAILDKAYNALKREKSWEQMELIRNNKQTLDMIADYYFEGMEGTKGKAANGDGGARYSIQTTENGKQYVEADRNVISGDNPSEWAHQVEDYINNEIRHGRDVTVYSANGVPLTITADTAGKATFRNFVTLSDGSKRPMTDSEYVRKLNAESHIDEIAQVSRGTGSTVPDRKNHPFAKDGFNYRTAYFKDDSGYYELRLSVGKNGNVNTIYNVGKITEADFPTRGLKGPTRSKTETRNTASIDNMPQTSEDVKFSRKDDVSVTAKDVQKLQKENDKLTQALDLVRQELKITQGHHVKPAVIDRLAGRILKDYQSTMPKTELVESITQLFDYIGNGERVIWDEVQAGAMNIALNVLDKSTQRNTEWYDATKPARDYLKNTAKAH